MDPANIDFPVDLKSLVIKETALARIQTFRSMGKCMVLAGGAIWGRVFFIVIGLLLNSLLLVISLLLNSATKKSTSLLWSEQCLPFHKYTNTTINQIHRMIKTSGKKVSKISDVISFVPCQKLLVLICKKIEIYNSHVVT